MMNIMSQNAVVSLSSLTLNSFVVCIFLPVMASFIHDHNEVVKLSPAGGFETGYTSNDEIKGLVPDNQIPNHVTSLPWKPDSPVPKKFYAGSRNCNPHNYNYLINHPHLCLQTPDVFLLIGVKTKFAHFDRRMAIRETWGVTSNDFPGRESTMMRQVWQSIEHHHRNTQLSPFGEENYHMSDPSVTGILYLTVSLMLIDILVVTIIFVLIFYKRGRRKK
ncbi:hypothetical protein ScPMuIL_001453 [Solemya velum]